MEIRTMRCCMCPNKNDSYICRPPAGYDVSEKQCNFVLDFKSRFGRVFCVGKYIWFDGLDNLTRADAKLVLASNFEILPAYVTKKVGFGIYFKKKNNRYHVPNWARTKRYESRDEAQEALNAIAIKKGWKPQAIMGEV